MTEPSGTHRLNCRFETQRLTVESWEQNVRDVASRSKFAVELSPLLEPEVLKYLPEPLWLKDTPKAIESWIEARRAESDVCTVRLSKSSKLLGLLILAPFREPGSILTIHLGYLFAQNAWGKGFATELVRGLVHWCESQSVQMRLLGGVETGNDASAAVLKKAGFAAVEELSSEETKMFGLSIGDGHLSP